MPTSTKAYAALAADKLLSPETIQRRDPGDNDVVIKIHYCGVCHSDLHIARDEWNMTTYPCVPGHEIVGKVTQVGNNVTKFKVGDTAAL